MTFLQLAVGSVRLRRSSVCVCVSNFFVLCLHGLCMCVVWVCVEQGESIKLDPKLQAACSDDVAKLCPTVHPGHGAVSFAHSDDCKFFYRNLDNCKNLY